MTTQTHKHYEAARQAHYATSFSPEKRAIQFCAGFDVDIKTLQDAGVSQAKIDRYEALAVTHLSAKSRCMSSMITGPANFPTARNEKANAVERKRSDEASEYFSKILADAKKEAHYAANPDARPVMSGDADALERLQAKVEKMQASQEMMKAANKIIRKKPVNEAALLEVLNGRKDAVEALLTPDYAGRLGFATYQLTNNNANIKRVQGRIAAITKRKESGPKEVEINGVQVVQNTEEMRLQIIFEGKPDADTRTVLKKNGFRWAPSKNAWQRQLTNNALFSFKHYVLPTLQKLEA